MIKIHFDIVSRYDKQNEPATVSIPLEKGKLFETALFTAAVVDGVNSYPAQFKAVAKWGDGSIKWLLINFLADLPKNKAIDYYFTADTNLELKSSDKVTVSIEHNTTVIDTGSIKVYLGSKNEQSMFKKIVTQEHTYNSDEIKGPFIVDANDNKFCIQIGENGWGILENGPVRAIVRTSGKHYDSNKKAWFDYTLILKADAGKPWINFEYQFINCEIDKDKKANYKLTINNEQAGLKYSKDYAFEYIKGIEVELKPHSDRINNVKHSILTSSFNYFAERSDAQGKLYKLITADTIIDTPNEMFPEVMFSVFAADWNDENYAFSAGIYQAYQNFPKALYSSANSIILKLLPDDYENLKVPQGVARTSRFHLHFHNVNMDERIILDRELQFEMPVVPVIEAEQYINSMVFENLVSNKYHHATERFLYRYVDSRAKGLGILNFGDGPEWEYVKQGRSQGHDIWINNEYDMPHNFMIMLARTGDRRYFDYMKAAVEHWYDVDICHFSDAEYKQGLLYTHSVDHITGQPVPSHQWVEGFLDYYHTTGNILGLETALSIGDNLFKLVQLPIYSSTATIEPREIGWAMRTFIALYAETNDEKWLNACEPIVNVYIKWADEFGTWTSPYPDNYLDRVPFMIHVGIVGLYKYYSIRKDERAKQTILAVIDDMIEQCYIERADTFYGKQAPAVRFLNLNGMVLETLAIAYELTGKKEYIRKGLGMFKWISVENQPPIYDFSKVKRDNFTVIYDCPVGPKRCAQTLLPFLHYYKHAADLGYLPN